MTKAKEILGKYPSVKLGLDDHYGKQTVLNAINEALHIHDVVEQSEQLVAFGIWLDKNDKHLENGNITETVKEYLEGN